MDWKIVLVIVIGLVVFGIVQLCSEDEKPKWDAQMEAEISDSRKKYEDEKKKESAKEADAKKEEARKLLGERPPEETAELETEHFRAVFTTQGGSLRSFELKDQQYKEAPRDWTTGMRVEDPDELVPVNLVSTNPDGHEEHNPLRFEIRQGIEGLLYKTDYEIVSKTADSVLFKYDQPNLPIIIYKKFELDPDSGPYQLWLTTRVVNRSDAQVSFYAAIAQKGYQHTSETEGGIFSQQPNFQNAICRHADDTFREYWTEEDGEPLSTGFSAVNGVKFAGVETNYFLSAMIPGDDAPTTCYAIALRDRVVKTELRWGETSLNPGESKVFKVKNYLGPKRYQLLQTIGHDLEESVDYGWFAPISRILLALLFFFQKLVVNWGVAIILLTVVVKLVLMPLTHKSFKSSDRMKALKPEVDKINEKYKDDPQEKQKAVMGLYKQHKVNPVGGCLPMLLQMPIWFALFRTLRASPELYRAEFFGWIHDLSSPDPYYITPIVMGAMMFLQQMMMPMTGDNAQAKILKYFMPIIFTVMMLFLPSGLTLYILVNTVLSILHQVVIHRMREKRAKA